MTAIMHEDHHSH